MALSPSTTVLSVSTRDSEVILAPPDTLKLASIAPVNVLAKLSFVTLVMLTQVSVAVVDLVISRISAFPDRVCVSGVPRTQEVV